MMTQKRRTTQVSIDFFTANKCPSVSNVTHYVLAWFPSLCLFFSIHYKWESNIALELQKVPLHSNTEV